MDKTVLITGANGQLGQEIALLSRRYKNFNFLFTDVDTLDITNLQDLEVFFKKKQPAFVVNCAAYTAVDKAESEPEKANLVNNIAVENLAKVCQKHDTPVIHISTDYVFDGRNFRPYKETDSTNPLSVYGKTKLDGEKHLLDNPKAVIIRTSWLYSTFGHNFVKTIKRLAKERSFLNVVADQVGTPTNAKDLAAAIMTIIKEYFERNCFFPGIYHFSNEGVASWYDFAREIVEFYNFTCKIRPIPTEEFPTPAKRPYYSVLDKSKIKKTYGIEILHWKESLKRCLLVLAE